MIITMRDITVGLCEHLELTSSVELYLSIKYTDRILMNSDLKKYIQVLLVCKDTDRGLAGNKWTTRVANNATI